MTSWPLLLVLLLWGEASLCHLNLFSPGGGQQERHREEGLQEDHTGVLFSEPYDVNEIPPVVNGDGLDGDGDVANVGESRVPLLVNFSIHLVNILAIDEPNQVISLESTLRLSWYDRRLRVHLPDEKSNRTYLLFNRDPVKNIWFPDVFVDKAKDLRVPVYKIPPEYLRVYNDSRILFSARVNYDIACPMSFENYPVDTQTCEVLLESWGTTADKLVFRWREEECKVNERINLNQHGFEVEFHNQEQKFPTGSFPGVVMRLTFKRKLSYHMLRTYLPSFLFVALAWFSMFIPLEHVPGRVTMGMTTLLTLASMFGSLSSITPAISYTTKLDVWMVGCIVFVFATLAEFTVVIFLKYYLADLPPLGSVTPLAFGDRIAQAWTSGSKAEEEVFRRRKKGLAKLKHQLSAEDEKPPQSGNIPDRAEKIILAIEKFSVIVFLFSFMAFNAVYWLDIVSSLEQQ